MLAFDCLMHLTNLLAGFFETLYSQLIVSFGDCPKLREENVDILLESIGKRVVEFEDHRVEVVQVVLFDQRVDQPLIKEEANAP